MEYIVYYSDDLGKYLSHHGVKGMEWGVWNEETKEKYGYTMLPGAKIKRFASEREGKEGTDRSKPFYATQNERDYENYYGELEGLPGTRSGSKVSAITMKAIEPVAVASGRQIINDLFGMEDIPKHEAVGLSRKASEKLHDPEVRERYKKMGFDAIEDLEDQLLFTPNGRLAEHPLIVLNGSKFKPESTEFFNINDDGDYEHYPKW